MLDIFSGLRLVVKRRSISIDNAVFRCHWFFTSTLLVSFSLIITARQYVGQPIECHSTNKIPDTLLNSYCWVQSTFTVPQACNKQPGVEVPYPCIDNARGREIKLYAYYQWVGMVLFVQGLMFHLPYYLWKVWENGLIRAITGGLRVAVLSDQERAKKKDIVVDYIHGHLGCHRPYALKYFLCEFICLVNLMVQLWATNRFFDGQFLRYGIDVLNYSSLAISSQLGMQEAPQQQQQQQQAAASIQHQLNRSLHDSDAPSNVYLHHLTSNQQAASQSTLPKLSLELAARHSQPTPPVPQQHQVDPMTYIFPRMTKCTYYDFGGSGDIQKTDALCLLPLNIINEKIYIALWFWFIVLAIITLLVIIYRLIAMVSESVRCTGLISRCKLSLERDIRIICHYCDVGDWFLFYMVAENLDPLIMREIIEAIASKIKAHVAVKRELGVIAEPGQSISCVPSDEPARTVFSSAAALTPAGLLAGRFVQAPPQQMPPAFAWHGAAYHSIGGGSEGGSGSGGGSIAGLPAPSAPEAPPEGRAREHTGPDETLAGASSHPDNRAHQGAPSAPPSRRGSQTGDEVPLVRRLTKRLYNKRLWSADLSTADVAQHLFGRQPATNPDLASSAGSSVRGSYTGSQHVGGGGAGAGAGGATAEPPQLHRRHHQGAAREPLYVSTDQGNVSAPPSSQMLGLGAFPAGLSMRRRPSLTRTSSSSSCGASTDSGAYVIELQPILGSTPCLAARSGATVGAWARAPAHRHIDPGAPAATLNGTHPQ